jgi:uncharacterized protein (DUF433 family)
MSVTKSPSQPSSEQIGRIVKTPAICGGEPRIAGTRITVRAIVELLEVYQGAIAEVIRDLPDLTEKDVQTAVDYARTHPDEIAYYRQLDGEIPDTELPNFSIYTLKR